MAPTTTDKARQQIRETLRSLSDHALEYQRVHGTTGGMHREEIMAEVARRKTAVPPPLSLSVSEAVRTLIEAALEEPQDSPLYDQCDYDGQLDPRLREGLESFRATLNDGTVGV